MKYAAFDIGDVWTGVALSDPMGIIAKPYQTIQTKHLFSTLPALFEKEKIESVIIGYPKTMRGTESEQTKKIIEYKERLEKEFTHMQWILWDERLSSKRAASLKQARTKEEKQQSHAIAAAFILESYLNYCFLQKNS